MVDVTVRSRAIYNSMCVLVDKYSYIPIGQSQGRELRLSGGQ